MGVVSAENNSVGLLSLASVAAVLLSHLILLSASCLQNVLIITQLSPCEVLLPA